MTNSEFLPMSLASLLRVFGNDYQFNKNVKRSPYLKILSEAPIF
ncbi:hypothetical protein CWATWH0402_1307 [Crocosphaera watsonii WH 0402]|uniref:Uncharacterized protein n=1 Tax=Crocosphaera watsonii WH 0402 TaxID=1284629 RepID=T2JX52_CROWT|nr:hypothetical protein CWATWH0402_1307 [Crocosphaera watsonii WH 0402]